MHLPPRARPCSAVTGGKERGIDLTSRDLPATLQRTARSDAPGAPFRTSFRQDTEDALSGAVMLHVLCVLWLPEHAGEVGVGEVGVQDMLQVSHLRRKVGLSIHDVFRLDGGEDGSGGRVDSGNGRGDGIFVHRLVCRHPCKLQDALEDLHPWVLREVGLWGMLAAGSAVPFRVLTTACGIWIPGQRRCTLLAGFPHARST